MEERRFLWVVRTTMDKRRKIDLMLETAQNLRQNNLLVQINGRGEAYYRSQMLPPAPGLDFDPLDYLLEKARGLGMKIHGWINAFTVGSFTRPPENPDHVLNQHPDWVLVDREGNSLWDFPPEQAWEALPTFMLDPGLPEVQEHVASTFLEVVESYSLDGIHFDYLRYPTAEYGYHERSCQRFQEKFGFEPPRVAGEKGWEEWCSWRQEQVNEVLRLISSKTRQMKPEMEISAAVYPDLKDSRESKLQDWPYWLESKLVDSLLPMAYSPRPEVVQKQLETIQEEVGRDNVYPGLGAFQLLDNPRQLVEIIQGVRHLDFPGVALFSYDSLAEKEQVLRVLREEAYPAP